MTAKSVYPANEKSISARMQLKRSSWQTGTICLFADPRHALNQCAETPTGTRALRRREAMRL